MSIWGKLFGSQKVVDSVISAGDAIVYTEEEKKENHKTFLKLYEPFKVAQRYLAMIFSIPFAILHTGVFSVRVAYWDNPVLQKSMKVIQSDINDSLGTIVLVIIGFYFAAGATEGVIKRFREGNDSK